MFIAKFFLRAFRAFSFKKSTYQTSKKRCQVCRPLRLERTTGTFSRVYDPRPCRSTPLSPIKKTPSGVFLNGVEGSRTPVQNTIPCPSTIIVHYFSFPLPGGNAQPTGFSSPMTAGSRLVCTGAQDIAPAVSCDDDAGIRDHRENRADGRWLKQQLTRNYRLRLNLIVGFYEYLPRIASPASGILSKPVLPLKLNRL